MNNYIDKLDSNILNNHINKLNINKIIASSNQYCHICLWQSYNNNITKNEGYDTTYFIRFYNIPVYVDKDLKDNEIKLIDNQNNEHYIYCDQC